MTTNIRISCLLAGACLLIAGSAAAQVPQLLNYQGRVTVNGTNFSGTAQLKFALINAAGTTNYWSNDNTSTGQPSAVVPLTVTNGLYAVLLGDTTLTGMTAPVPPSALAAPNVYLRTWFSDGVTGLQQLTPDQRLAAVGYALVAASVNSTGDLRALRLNIGSNQTLRGVCSTIAGGLANLATNDYTAIGGGLSNGTTAFGAVIAGGELNSATGTLAAVGGGYGNLAGGIESTVAGGDLNGAYGSIATVGGGYGNLASGYASTIPGGYANLASGSYSLAAGAGACATNFGSFVWADASNTNFFYSGTNNSFSARCAGGVRFLSNSNATVGVQLAPGGNAFSATSDRNLKEHFKPVDARDILARLVATPVTEWNLISQDPTIRHIGPMAQDFKAAFAVGEDDRHISTSDADGVAFAAIQGLHQLLQEKEARIAELEKRLQALEQRLPPVAPATAVGR